MPGAARAISMALRTSASMSRPGAGRTWMVTSRPTSDCQSFAALTTSITAPVVNEARKAMMATTAASERPAIELLGTSGVRTDGAWTGGGPRSSWSQGSAMVATGSVIDMQASLMQDQPARVVFVHQRDVVRGDDDGGAGFVELDEQPQQSLAETGIDVAGRLIRQQELRARDHGAGYGRALLLAAGENRRQRPHALAQSDPLQQLDDLRPVVGFLLTKNAQRKRYVLVGGHVVQQPEILEDDADASPQARPAILTQGRRVMVEHADQAARRPQRQQHQAQQRGLAGAGRAGEELEGVPVDL